MSLHSSRSLMAAMAGLIAANPALAGRVSVVDAEIRREQLPGRLLSHAEALKAYATSPADPARATQAPHVAGSPGPGMTTVLLHELPPDHVLRTTPLSQVPGAQIRNKQSQLWRDMPGWYIGRCAYNDLGPSWAECNEFRAEAQP